MSSDKKLLPTKYAQRTYYATQPINFDVAMNYAAALMAVAGADGSLAEEELQWYLDEQELNLHDATEYLEAIRGIDWKSVKLDEVLPKISYDFPLNARTALLYQAVKMSSADGVYHEKERAAIAKAAELLGIKPAVTIQIEALVEMEKGCERLRKALLTM